jgi:hypothetical protein
MLVMSQSRAQATAARVLEDRMRAQGHKFPALAARQVVSTVEISCGHPRSYSVVQTSLLGGEELQRICSSCGHILSIVEAA